MTRKVFTDKVLPHTKLISSPRSLGDADLVRCTVQGGTVAQYEDPEFGLRVHDLSLRDRRVGGVLHGVQFSDVSVHDLASGDRVTHGVCSG